MADFADVSSPRAESMLGIVLNGVPAQSPAGSLQDMLDAGGFAGVKVATAVNGTFIPARARATYQLAAGDQIEVVSARQGG